MANLSSLEPTTSCNTIVDVCVCTFRRPKLLLTLQSIADQKFSAGVELRVIVADNDSEQRLNQWLIEQAEQLGLDIKYIHAPAFNISIARNACLDAASGDLVAFIDDDEIAPPNWIETLLDFYRQTGAGAIFGSAHATYPDTSPDWIRRNDFHSHSPSRRGGLIETGSSGNVLLDRNNVQVIDHRFDLTFGKTGGEDVDFFFRLQRKGVKMEICETSFVFEPVEEQRLSFRWLTRRRFAVGKIYSFCLLQDPKESRSSIIAKSCAKLFYCMMGTLIFAWSPPRAAYWWLRSMFHAGVVSGGISRPSRQIYGLETTQ